MIGGLNMTCPVFVLLLFLPVVCGQLSTLFYTKSPGNSYNSTVLDTVSVVSEIQCSRHCLMMEQCMSVNMIPEDDGFLCQLLQNVAFNSDDLDSSQNTIYMGPGRQLSFIQHARQMLCF